MKKVPYVATLVAFSFFLSGFVYAASCDCKLAQSQAEKTICANEYLSALDSIMSDFYSKVRSYSLNEKALAAQQKQWWQERNQCNEDTKCLQKAYQNRIEKLESEYKWIAFKPIEQSRLDYVLERQGKAPVAETHTDFIAKDNYWDIRPFYSSYSDLEDVLEKEYGFHTKVSARITLEGYRFEQGVLYLYATFSYSIPSQSFLVELTDHLPPKVITNYKEGDFIIPGTPKKTWLGMCGSDTCYSYYASPNHIWQVATKNENDAIYLFPNNKPNEG